MGKKIKNRHELLERREKASSSSRSNDDVHNSFELSAFFSCLLCLMNKLCVLRRRRLPVSGYRSSIFSFVRSVVKEHHSMHFQRLLFLVFSLCVVGLIAQSKKQKPQEFRHHCIHDTLRYEEAKTYQPLKLTPDPNYNRKRFASQTSAPPLHEPIRIFLSPILDNDPYTCYSVGQQVQTGQGPYSCTSQDILTATLKQFLLNIVNDAITILEGTLNVVPMQGNLILGTSNCGAQPPVSVPQEYQTTGVPNADYVLFLTARPIVNMGSDNSVLAYGLSCLANSINRPVAGQINFNPSALNTDPDFYRAQVRIALHELSHALGFTYQKFSQFVQWVNSTTAVPIPPSQTLSVVQSSTLNKQVTYIITPIATSTVQSYFGCSSLPGLELEDGGGPGTAGSHPEKRVFQNEYLTGEATSFPIFSNISLSVFADSGWYQLNYTYVESLVWGRGMGCNFAMNHCVPPNWPSNDGYYCSDTTGLVETCTFDRIGYGICNLVTYNQPLPPQFQYFSNPDLGGIDMLADYCPYMQSNTLCIQSYGTGNSAPGRTLSDITSAGETYCATCRCFSSSLGQPTGLATDNRCYNVTCAAPNDLRVQIGGVWYQCPYGGGSISNVIGFGGSLTCDPQLADTLCLEAPMVPAEQWPVYESISPTEGAPGSQVTITGRNFNLTGSMSVTIGAPCTNVVINSDTQLVATIADASNFGDPIYLTRPQLAVIITDGRGLTDYKTNQYIVDVSLNSNYFAALGQWIKNNPVWFVLILLAFIIPIICLIYCCRKCCCKKKKKPTRGKYRVSVAQNYNHNSAKQQHIAPQSLRPSSTSYPVQEQTLNYDPSNSAPYFTTPAPTAVVAAPPLSPGIPPSSPQPQVDVDSQSDPSEVSVSST
jgi:leishmanolysin